MQVSEGIYAIDVAWPLATELGVNERRTDGPGDVLSIHVVDTPQATVQFTAGHETIARDVIELAREYGVDVVIAEHGDPDHYGAAPRLSEELGVEVAIPSGDAESIKADGVEPDVLLEGGEQQWGIDVIDAPGHTPGNLAFRYNDALIAGDTVIGSAIELVADDDWSGPLALSPPNRNQGGDERAQQSVNALLALDFDRVLIAHGADVLDDGGDAVETLVTDLERGIERGDRGVLT